MDYIDSKEWRAVFAAATELQRRVKDYEKVLPIGSLAAKRMAKEYVGVENMLSRMSADLRNT